MPANPVLVEAKRLSRLGAARTAAPLMARHQVRVDISPMCLCACTVDSGRYGNFYFEPTSSLDSAFAAFEKYASSRRLLSRGTVLLMNLTSDQFKNTPIDIGPNKQFKRVVEVDVLARRDPTQLRLDPTRFAYRAIKTTDTQAHLLTVEVGNSELFDYDQKGVRMERYSSIFSAVDYFLDRHADYFSPQTLLCVADQSRGFMFAIRRGAITGMRTVPRMALGSPKEFRDTAQSFAFDSGAQGDGYAIVLASLTPNVDDLERAGKNMAGEIVSNVGLVGIEDMLAVTPEMTHFQSAPYYPVSLFRTGKSDLSPAFYTVKESNRPQLTSGQLFQIRLLRFIQILLILGIIAAPLGAAWFYYEKSQTPEWNVNEIDLNNKEAEVKRLSALRNYVATGQKIANTRLNFPQLLHAIYHDIPPKFILKRIEQNYSETGSDPKNKQPTWTINITGSTPQDENSEIEIQNYVQKVNERINNYCAPHTAALRNWDSTLDSMPKNNVRYRSFRIIIELKIPQKS